MIHSALWRARWSWVERRRSFTGRGQRPALCLLAALVGGCDRPPAPGSDGATATAASAAAVAPSLRARPARLGLDPSGHPQPSDEDRCAMCGMKVVDHRDWVGAIETRAGAVFYLCSPRCTIGTARHSERFLGVGADAIVRVRVPEYLRPERSLAAESAYFVVGSDVRGPMGAALLPAATEADAATLVRRHGGRVVRYDEVDVALLKSLKEPQGPAPSSVAPAPPPR